MLRKVTTNDPISDLLLEQAVQNQQDLKVDHSPNISHDKKVELANQKANRIKNLLISSVKQSHGDSYSQADELANRLDAYKQEFKRIAPPTSPPPKEEDSPLWKTICCCNFFSKKKDKQKNFRSNENTEEESNYIYHEL